MGRKRKSHLHLPNRVYPHGKGFRYAHPDGTYTKLPAEYSKMLEAVARLNLDPGELNTLGQVMDHYELHELPKRAARSHNELRAQLQRLRLAFGHMRGDDVTPPMIYAYMDHRPPVIANREVSLLSTVFRLAIRKGVASDNPCRLVTRNTETARDRYVTDEEVAAVQALAPDAVRIAMEIAVVTGCDLSVILGIRLADIRDGVLHVGRTKTGREGKRPFYVKGRLASAIEDAREMRQRGGMPLVSAYLLPNRQGKRYTLHGFESLWQPVMARYVAQGGTHFQFRDLRAKAATDSATIEEAAERLDHSSSAITKKVYHRKPRPMDPL